MIPLDEAQQYVLSGCAPLPAASISAADALGLVTAESIVSREQVPPFDNTAVDGYAVQAADTADAPVELNVIGAIAAGDAPTMTVAAGEAVRIMTGAPPARWRGRRGDGRRHRDRQRHDRPYWPRR